MHMYFYAFIFIGMCRKSYYITVAKERKVKAWIRNRERGLEESAGRAQGEVCMRLELKNSLMLFSMVSIAFMI